MQLRTERIHRLFGCTWHAIHVIISYQRATSMSSSEASPITELLRRGTVGDRGCLDELVPLVEHELRQMAREWLCIEIGEAGADIVRLES